MSYFKVIDQIEISHKGPVAKSTKRKKQLIHLAQGSMDGACGPYSLMMALMICGMIDREDLVSLNRFDGRTRAGKLINMLQEYEAFFRNGTDLKDLVKLLDKSYSSKLKSVSCDKTGVDVKKFVKKHIDENHPVILGLDYSRDGGHWVVAIGYEYLNIAGSKKKNKSEGDSFRFLLLDPDDKAPIVSAWNGVVDANVFGKEFPHVWWGKDYKVKFSGALALCPK